MNTLTLIGIAIGLGMDAFAVAVATGAMNTKLTARRLFRLSWHFGLFQFLMPIIGWLIGRRIAHLVGQYDHWLAFGLLAFIGGKMVVESFHHEKTRESAADPTKGWTLVVLSVATSIDALAVGLSLAFLNVNVVTASVVIGVFAFAMTAVGMLCGRWLGVRFGRRMELVGGLILIAIGVNILIQHLSA
jgi:manganese efflux pump family protein